MSKSPCQASFLIFTAIGATSFSSSTRTKYPNGAKFMVRSNLAATIEHVLVIENPNIRPVENFPFTPPQAPAPMSHSTPFVKAEEINTLAEVWNITCSIKNIIVLCEISTLFSLLQALQHFWGRNFYSEKCCKA